MTAYTVRDSHAGDLPQLERLYPGVFPGEDLLALVRSLMLETPGVLSLVAVAGDVAVAHAVFTHCGLGDRTHGAALLGPLAVAQTWQRRGIGRTLVRAGLDRLRGEGVGRVCVLGVPGYYARFGFAPERAIAPPFTLPAEWRDAWQSLGLNGAPGPPRGRLSVPPAWQDQRLWAP